MGEIRTKPSNEKFRKGFERTFRKPKRSGLDKYLDDCLERSFENVIKEFKTQVCVNNDPHYGG